MPRESSRRRRLTRGHGCPRDWAPLLALFLSLFATSGRMDGANGPHGTVDLVADQTSVLPGTPFWVGLHFRLEAGWHIYWTNPGDSGEPPRIKWSLPAAFQAGPLNWPIPQRIEDHTLIDYGYQKEVMLPAQITPPARLDAGVDTQIGSTVNWLVCRDICVPGRASLTLKLPIRNG